MPPMNRIGMNTAISETVIEMIVKPILFILGGVVGRLWRGAVRVVRWCR